jgi:hypothetical protein
MKEIGLTIKEMVKELKFIQMEINIAGNGKKIINMDKEYLTMQMEISIKGNL